jgi:hypothetical protein
MDSMEEREMRIARFKALSPASTRGEISALIDSGASDEEIERELQKRELRYSRPK